MQQNAFSNIQPTSPNDENSIQTNRQKGRLEVAQRMNNPLFDISKERQPSVAATSGDTVACKRKSVHKREELFLPDYDH